MARFYVSRPQIENEMLKIEGREARHVCKVLRLKSGDEITVFDGVSKEYEGRIVQTGPSSVVILIQRISSIQKGSNLEITLGQSLLKGEKMDYLIQKATELGVGRIIPFFSSRSVPRLEKSKGLERHGRWEKIAIEASKQCGRGILPKIERLQDYSEMLRFAALESLRLILWEREGTGLREVLDGLTGKKNVFFIVGPEGGFGQEEAEQAKKEGFIPVTLGKRILRAETASLCLLSILQYEMGDIA